MVAPPVNATLGQRFQTAFKNLAALPGGIQKAVTDFVPNVDEAATMIPGEQDAAANHPIVTNAANDIAAVLSAPAQMIAHPLATVENFIPATLSGLGQGLESLTIPFGGNPNQIKSQWAAHPVLQVLNLVGFGDIFGGVINAGAKAAIRTSVVSEASDAADAAVASEAITPETAAAVKTTVTPKLVSSVIDNLTTKKAPQAIVTDQIHQAFVRSGVDAATAAHLTQATLETIADRIKSNLPMKVGNALSHPISSLSGFASPVTDAIKGVFSKPAQSAVSYLFGDEAIAKNPTAFAQMEESASQQLGERGIADTVENRIGIMSDWAKTNPDWAMLNTEGKAAHMTNFAQTTPMIQQINEMTGKTYVPVKALAPDAASAAISDVSSLPGEASAAVDVGKILDNLGETLGANFNNWRSTIERAVTNNPTKQGLIDAITSITRKTSFNFPSDDAAAAAAMKMEEQTGYRVGIPPQGKPINFVSENPDLSFLGKPSPSGSTPSIFTNDTLNKLLTNNNWWQGMLDRFGLSTQGGVGSGLDAMYGDEFGKRFNDAFGSKYADGIKLPSIVTEAPTGDRIGLPSGTTRTIPQSGLYSYLDRMLGKINPNANTVADLTTRDLTDWGFPKEAAGDIAATARKAMQLPIAVTGVGQGLVNFLRANARIPGLDGTIFGSFNKYLNATVALKYNSPLAFFYQARLFTKFNLLRQFATGKFVMNLGDNTISNWLAERPFVGNIIAPKVSVEDTALMNNTLWGDLHPSTFDMSTAPEVLKYTEQMKTQSTGILSSLTQAAKSGFLSWVNFSVRNDSVTLAKGLASQYGMSLREALGYTTDAGGRRIYNNPALYNNILDTIESTYHYAPGFLTSPMIRNLNTVFYPLRFEAKVLQQTGAWMGRLSPITRGEMMLNMSHFAAWTGTPSGAAWIKKNQTLWSQSLNYLLPFASEGQMVQAAASGKFFNGDLGELGGIPFAFPLQVMQGLSLMPGQETGVSPDTGAKYTKRTPKNLASPATAEEVFQDFFTTMLPSLPLSTILGSGAPSVTLTEQSLAQKAFIALTTGQTDSKSNQKFNGLFKTVPEGYFRQ